MSAAPRIRTTVVGSYPVPEWLVAAPSEQALIDATRVVIATQEAAGVDVVCDGELYRFDVNHPQTNGMIEYFVRPMQGVRLQMTFDEVMAYRALPGMRFRTRPPGVVEGALESGTLDLPLACQRAKALATKTFKFTVTGPHMLAKTLLNRHYPDTPALAHAIADVLAKQVAHLDADIVQLDEANLPGHPEEWEWAASALNRVLDAVKTTPAVHLCFGNFKGLKPEIGFGLGVVDIKATEIESADAVARAIERAEQLLGAGRVRYIHPDCGFWMLKRPIADAKIRALAQGRDLYEGRTG